jgi:hypothetical protein
MLSMVFTLLDYDTLFVAIFLNMIVVDASDFVHLVINSTPTRETAIRFQGLTSSPSDAIRVALCFTHSLVAVFTQVFLEECCCYKLARVALFQTHGVSQSRLNNFNTLFSVRPRCVGASLIFHLHCSLMAHSSTTILPCQASSNALAF